MQRTGSASSMLLVGSDVDDKVVDDGIVGCCEVMVEDMVEDMLDDKLVGTIMGIEVEFKLP